MSDIAAETAFVRAGLSPPLPPPRQVVPMWQRWNLFGGWLNTALTLLSLSLIWLFVWPAAKFLIVDAVWAGASREDCLAQTLGREAGACWPFIAAKFSQFIYGFYPASERWRVDLTFLLGAGLLLPLLIPRLPYKALNSLVFFGIYPIAAFLLLVGGVFGLAHVETRLWGGLLITLVVAFTGMIVSLPLGVLLALARRSAMPVVQAAAVIFIEFWRGVPLVAVLFFATYMLPLFLPPGWSIDALLRVLVGIALFASAYMAEVVRGGLQAIPRGQYEAASALGLGYWKSMRLIIMPQALKLVIPGIVNTFIALFKDTTLVLIIGLFDLLKTVETAIVDPNWRNVATEGHLFAAFAFWIFCFGMSRYSQSLERKLETGHKR